MSIHDNAKITKAPDFFRINFHCLIWVIAIFYLLLLFVLGNILYYEINIPVIQYFATTTDGRIIEIYPSK